MKTLILVYLALFVLVASACQNGKGEASISGNGSGTNCISNPATCYSTIYQQNNGYTNYGGTGSPFNNYNNSNYLCNCPAGTIPTYNSQAGLGCVRTAAYSSNAGLSTGLGLYGYLYIGWGTNHELHAVPQLYRYNYSYGSNYNYGYTNNNSCYNGAVQSCVVGQANNCPTGYACRQSSSQSTLGLCVTAYR